MNIERIRRGFKSRSWWLKRFVDDATFDLVQEVIESLFTTTKSNSDEIEILKKRMVKLEKQSHNSHCCPCEPDQ